MLKGILGFFLFLFFLAILIIMLTGSFILKKVRDFRKAMQEAADQQAFNYRTETGRKETIIDNRHQERENKKIFDDSDGEYVDFVEER